jgi:hypothetical protein
LPAVWLAIAGLLAVPSVIAVIAAALTRETWRALAKERRRMLVAWGGTALALFVPLGVVAGAALQASTHHRGLGGATYGAFATAALGAVVIVAYRVVDWLVRVVGAMWASRIGATLAALAGVSALALGARSLASLSPRAQVGIVDAVVWLFAIAVGAAARTPARVGRAGLATAVGVCVALLGSAAVLPLRSPDLGRAIREGAPTASPMSGIMDGPLR